MGDTVLVGGEERLVPLIELLGLGEHRLEFGVDDLSNGRRKRFGKAVESLAEPKKLDVESRVRGVDGVCGRKALQGQQVLACCSIKSVISL
jgi:hypothetical protein